MSDVRKIPLIISILFLNLIFMQGGRLLATEDDVYERLKIMEEDINRLKQELARQQEQNGLYVREKEADEEQEKKIDELLTRYDAVQKGEEEDADDFYFAKKTKNMEEKGLAQWFGDIRTKPFLKRFGRNTYLGGYMDVEFRATEASESSLRNAPNPPASDRNEFDTFRQFRFIPFIYSDVSERVKLAAELEFEFGGVGGGRNGEVIIEFGTIDFLITDWINWRGGVILSPLGKLNLIHDTPLQDLADRPLVDQMIIPTTGLHRVQRL